MTAFEQNPEDRVDGSGSEPQKKRSRTWSSKPGDGEFDYIVIGSGMGGMTCAASLAKMGRRVLVLEQHFEVGGYTHTFSRRQWTWDIGVHIVGEVTQDDEFGRLLHYLTDGRLEWEPLPNPYDRYHWPGGFEIEYAGCPDRFVETLAASFPNERKAIERWLQLSQRAYARFVRHVKTKVLPPSLGRLAQRVIARNVARDIYARTCSEVLDELTDNARLKAVLAGQWFYWGTPPSRTAWVASAAVVAHFGAHGAFYPKGGGRSISSELLRTVLDAGGHVRVLASVKEIMVEAGRVIGVRVAGRHGEPDEDIRCDRVISAAGLHSTASNLLPEGYRDSAWGRSIRRLPSSTAYVCLFLGFDGDIREVGASGVNHGYYDTWDIEATWAIELPDRVGRVPFMWSCFNSLKNPDHVGPHTGEVMAPIPWRHFEAWSDSSWKRRPQEYELFKASLTDQMLDQYLEYNPKLRPYVCWAELSTPLSASHFVRASHGATYGLDHGPERFLTDALRPQTPIDGFYLASTDTVCVGLLGAGFSGLVAAAAAEPLASLPILKAFMF